MKRSLLTIMLFAALVPDILAINPPGTKKVKLDNETLYIDQNEICIADWLEYINSIEHNYGKNSEELKSTLPAGIDSKEDLAKIKLTKSITGITLEQAQRYCEWRTVVVNSVNEETGLGNVNYSIPTEQQYAKLIKTFGSYEILSDKNKTERITGLQSSVYEFTAEGSVLKNNGGFSNEETIPSENIGFRCIATVTKQKK